jgi:hypothetical protein
MYRSAVVIPINYRTGNNEKVTTKDRETTTTIPDETGTVYAFANESDIETIADILSDKTLHLKKDIRYQRASYLAKGVGWLVKRSGT